MHLSIQHRTHYEYDPAPVRAALRLRLFPPATDAQNPVEWRVTVNGSEVLPLLTDASGDLLAQWHSHEAISEIEILAEGTVETTDTAGVLKGIDAMMPSGVLLRETPLTEPNETIEALANAAEGETALGRLHSLSEMIHKAIEYKPGETKSETTAAEVARAGSGVCQDQAHVFIAAARSIGVPARYVAGYLFDPDGVTAEDQTHAWAEAHVPGLGWVGFDITNQICPTDAYVRLACGLDAADAAPVRGILTGTPEETLTTQVSVTQAAAQSQQ